MRGGIICENNHITCWSYATRTFITLAPILFHNDSLGSNKGGNGTLHINACKLKGKTAAVIARSMNNGNNLTVRFTKNLAYTDKGTEDVINYWGSTKEKPGYFVGTDVLFDGMVSAHS